jgi:hypothetical protein
MEFEGNDSSDDEQQGFKNDMVKIKNNWLHAMESLTYRDLEKQK